MIRVGGPFRTNYRNAMGGPLLVLGLGLGGFGVGRLLQQCSPQTLLELKG